MDTSKQENWENFEKTGKISYYLAMKEEEHSGAEIPNSLNDVK